MTKQWTADEVLHTIRAFQPACVLAAAAELDVFSALHSSSMSALSLAGQLGSDPRATAVLLDALASLGLLTKQAKQYAVPSELVLVLGETEAGNILPAIRHQANCLRRWAQLARVILTGKPPERSASTRGEAADEAAFIGAMDNFSDPVANDVVKKLLPLEFRHLLDVGGASGTWTIAFLNAVPGARATLFDLPSVIPIARRRLAGAGLADRITLAAGDYFVDDLPKGADFALLSAIAHQNSRKQNLALFAKIHAALDVPGVIVLRDIVMDPDRTSPPQGAMFAVNMLVATEGGGTYTFDEFRDDLTAAGFADVSVVHRDKGMNCLIRASKTG